MSRYDFTTEAGAKVSLDLNLSRDQWEYVKATPDKMGLDDLFAFADELLGEEARHLGALDVSKWYDGWSDAFRGALGLGESDGSTEPSTESTEQPSRSTSGGSRASRSKK